MNQQPKKRTGMIQNVISTLRNLRGLKDLMNTGQTRDMDTEFGHPAVISSDDYWKKFDRGDVASRVVSIYPEECFSEAPLIYETEDEEETEFERELNFLEDELHLSSFLLRADILSGVGRFGVMLLGLDDGLALDQPVAGFPMPSTPGAVKPVNNALPPPPPKPANEPKDTAPLPSADGTPPEKPKRRLLYLRTFDESLVTIKELEKDPRNPRFGQPKMYTIRIWDNNSEIVAINPFSGPLPPPSGINSTPAAISTNTFDVHWTRIIHLADNRLRDEIFGVPRLKRCFNRVLDLHKIAGGSAEMFWKTAKGGMALETIPDKDGNSPEIDIEGTKDEMEQFYEGLKPYIVLENMRANNISPSAVDPKPHAELQMMMIAMALACPMRIFMGSEVGQLASGQDIVAWNERMQKRREEYVSPFVIRPFIDRLIILGVLPFPSGGKKADTKALPEGRTPRPVYIIWWNDLNTPSEAEQATVAVQITEALSKYVAGGLDQIISPEHFLEFVIKFDKTEVDAIIEEVGDRLLETDPEAEHQQAIEKIEASGEAQAKVAKAGGATPPPVPGQPGGRQPFPAAAK